MSKHFVFVYGSLKKGFGNHHYLKDQKCFGEATIKGTMISLGWFPGVCAVGNDQIQGEVYHIDDETLARLDHLEGHPSFYERKLVWLHDGTSAWCYILPDSYLQEGNHKRIPDGFWRKQA